MMIRKKKRITKKRTIKKRITKKRMRRIKRIRKIINKVEIGGTKFKK